VEGATQTAPVADRAPAESPYVGLTYYTEAYADVFFGRESERTLIIGNLRAARLTILYAPSGVGKSSVLRAGVAARLRELALRGMSERGTAKFIPVVFSSWRDRPVMELIRELETAIRPFVSGPAVELPRTGLDAAIEAAAAAADATLLIVLDQFEEYFLYSARETTPPFFADELARCINRRELDANFLIAVREDAYAGIGDLLRGHVANPYGNNFRLDYLDRAAAGEAITRPIARFNELHPGQPPVEVEPALIEAVLDQVRTGQVAFEHRGTGTVTSANGTTSTEERIETPFLQLVMTALWERERAAGSSVLRARTLEELGGAQAIVRSHLDSAMSRLSDTERDTALEVFNHLVTPSGTKIVHTIPDLAQYGGRDVSQVQALAEKLSSGDQRILRPVPPAPGEDTPRVEIFHDVLAPAILAWRTAQNRERLERERKDAQSVAERERRRARVLGGLAVAALALLLVAIAAVIQARVETDRAHRAERLALSRQLAQEATTSLETGAIDTGVLLSIEAYRYGQNADSRVSLIHAVQATEKMVSYLGGHSAYVSDVAYSPDGRFVAAASGDGTVSVQNIATGRTVRLMRDGARAAYTVAYSPGGQLASGDSTGNVVLWNLASGRPQTVIRTGTASNSVAFNHDGTLLASAGHNGTVTVLDPASGRIERRLPAGSQVQDVAFGGGNRLAAAVGHHVIIWDAATGRREMIIQGSAGSVNAVAFSPSGRILASGNDDHTVGLWDSITGHHLLTLRGQDSFVNSVAFSPDGSQVASGGGGDDDVVLWSARTGRRLEKFKGHTDIVNAVAFSPTGRTLASGSNDNHVIVWAARPPLLKQVLAAGGPVLAVAYSHDHRLLASAQEDGTVDIWDAATGRRLRVLRGRSGPVGSVAFAPDNTTLAAGDANGTVVVWNALTGVRERMLTGHSQSIYGVAFSPDGRTLAAGDANETVILWNAATGARERTLEGHTDVVYSVAFSPNSRTLASASADKSVRLWDVASGRMLRTLTGQSGPIESVAYSPDGQMLASASNDGTVWLWNPSTGGRIGDPLSGQLGGPILTVAFAPGGGTVASAGAGGSVIQWDLSTRLGLPFYGHGDAIEGIAFAPGTQILSSASLDGTVQVHGPLPAAVSAAAVTASLCGVVKQNLGAAEWKDLVPGQPYHRTCPGAP
jgi:WD40 repeat protein